MISLDVFDLDNPTIVTYMCNEQDTQRWIWNAADGTLRSKLGNQCLMIQPELGVWAVPLQGGSQAVVLFNRGDNGREEITVKWTDIGFSADHSAVVRDLWAHQDLGVFVGNYTSPKIDAHAMVLLNITLTK